MVKDNLDRAKRAKNDEFYTLYSDVAKELAHYQQHFKNKVIYCNCDNPERSAFWRYFHINFSALGLKKLIATYKGNPTYKMEYTGGNDNDITVGLRTSLKGDGDFRSQECLDTLKESDIVVTNPPFSLFRKYVVLLVEHNKKFILIGNINAVSYKEIFPLIKEGKFWAGYSFNKAMLFEVDEGYTYDKKATDKIADGKKYARVPVIAWYTNLDINRQHEDLILTKNYTGNEINYPKYDHCDVINVSRVSDIPKDYFGIMGVPITFLGSWSSDQFEIIDLLSRYSIYDSQGINDYIKENHLHSCNIDGKATYARILIRRKVVTSDENS